MKEDKMAKDKVTELLLQALETEIGGVEVYRTALKCVQNEDLREEWEKYLDETNEHKQILTGVCTALGVDPNEETRGRQVVRHIGQSLVKAMELALEGGPSAAAERVAAECVVHAETKDHLNWELIGEIVKKMKGDQKDVLKDAYEEVEEQEDEHLYHTMGWSRELWLAGLGLPAVLPPPEEKKDVKTAIGAQRAKQSRAQMLRGK
jgi:rubrerythrin